MGVIYGRAQKFKILIPMSFSRSDESENIYIIGGLLSVIFHFFVTFFMDEPISPQKVAHRVVGAKTVSTIYICWGVLCIHSEI